MAKKNTIQANWYMINVYEKNEPKQEYIAEENPLAKELKGLSLDEIANLGESKNLTFQWYENSSPFFMSLKNGITEESENWKVYANEYLRKFKGNRINDKSNRY